MLYDCFLYNGESDILKLRLGVIGALVDQIVIVESSVAFSGRSKALTFKPTEWASYLPKINHIVVEDTPDSGSDRWSRERFQRNAIMRGLADCRADDLVLISDVDEIPDPAAVGQKRHGGYHCQISNYWINTIEDSLWVGPVMLYYSRLAVYGPQLVRDNRYGYQRVTPGGWHFTYTADPAKIVEKLQAFSHSEYDTAAGHELVLKARAACRSFVSGKECQPVDIQSGYFPQYLKDHVDEFCHLIKQT